MKATCMPTDRARGSPPKGSRPPGFSAADRSQRALVRAGSGRGGGQPGSEEDQPAGGRKSAPAAGVTGRAEGRLATRGSASTEPLRPISVPQGDGGGAEERKSASRSGLPVRDALRSRGFTQAMQRCSTFGLRSWNLHRLKKAAPRGGRGGAARAGHPTRRHPGRDRRPEPLRARPADVIA